MNIQAFKNSRRFAFTLVEVTLAIGIVAVAIVPVFGLIPTALNTFHRAIDASVSTQIAQRLINDAQQTDFQTLTGGAADRFVRTPEIRYFDDQGSELTGADTTGAIYQTRVVIAPNTQTTGAGAGNENLATIMVQIANNPRNAVLQPDGATLLWPRANTAGVPIVTYSAIVANNQ